MQIHQLKPIHKKKDSKRIGRGGKRGTYSGRGVKGQKSRSGRRLMPAVRSLFKKYHKLRGYRFKGRENNILAVNLGKIQASFSPEEKITPKTLIEKKIISKIKGRVPKVKILSMGEVKKVLTVKGCLVSKQAREKIEKAGGSVS
jgi:large subunit ribosomal protein L15